METKTPYVNINDKMGHHELLNFLAIEKCNKGDLVLLKKMGRNRRYFWQKKKGCSNFNFNENWWASLPVNFNLDQGFQTFRR